MKKLLSGPFPFPLALLLIAVTVVGFFSGTPHRNPYAFGYGDFRVCVPLTYRVTEIHPSHELSHAEAVTLVQEAAQFWNEVAGCEFLRSSAYGNLTISFDDPESRTNERCAGRYVHARNSINIYSTTRVAAVELLQHELGHAIGLNHVETGLMQPEGWYCTYGLPCPSAHDLAEFRNSYPLLF